MNTQAPPSRYPDSPSYKSPFLDHPYVIYEETASQPLRLEAITETDPYLLEIRGPRGRMYLLSISRAGTATIGVYTPSSRTAKKLASLPPLEKHIDCLPIECVYRFTYSPETLRLVAKSLGIRKSRKSRVRSFNNRG